jgi:predicted transport protein
MNELKKDSITFDNNLRTLLTENMDNLWGFKYISSDNNIDSFKLDIIAFDPTDNCFVILNFHQDVSESIIDYAFAYKTLLNNFKSSFVYRYNSVYPESLKKEFDFDWDNTKIIYIANSFPKFQRLAASQAGSFIYLLCINTYSNGIISIKDFSKNKLSESKTNTLPKVISRRSISISSTEKRLFAAKNTTTPVRKLYLKIKSKISNWDYDITTNVTKNHVSFKKEKIFCIIEPNKHSITIWINAELGSLEDSKNLFDNKGIVGHIDNGDYSLQLTSEYNLDYALSVIKQNFDKC